MKKLKSFSHPFNLHSMLSIFFTNKPILRLHNIKPNSEPDPSMQGQARHPSLAEDDEADVGISSIQVFMAMILISGATTATMLHTANLIREEAEQVAHESIDRFSGGFEFFSIMGDRDSTPVVTSDQDVSIESKIQYLEIKVRLIPGSQDIDLNALIIDITDSQVSQTLIYNPFPLYLAQNDTNISGRMVREHVKQGADVDTFTAYAISDPTDMFRPHISDKGVLNGSLVGYGSIINIYINLTANALELAQNTPMEIGLTPTPGLQATDKFRSPGAYSGRYIKL